MKLTKEECYEALDYLEGRIVCITVKMKRRLEKLINEHFDLEKRWKEVLEDNELLNKENEKLKRRILGMQQTISNQREQLESHYKSLR